MTERIIVTGGAGFIGSNLVQALNARGRDDILVVDHLNAPGKKQNLERSRFGRYCDKTEFRDLLRQAAFPRSRPFSTSARAVPPPKPTRPISTTTTPDTPATCASGP
jgi:hypothetical protein